jgi:ribosomal protein S9
MLKPFLITNTMGMFDVAAHVHGGGKSGQAQVGRCTSSRIQFDP